MVVYVAVVTMWAQLVRCAEPYEVQGPAASATALIHARDHVQPGLLQLYCLPAHLSCCVMCVAGVAYVLC